jgi:hypothetical protein
MDHKRNDLGTIRSLGSPRSMGSMGIALADLLG